MKSIYLLLFLFVSIFSNNTYAGSWKDLVDVIPFPDKSEINYAAVQSVYFEVYDVNAIRPKDCPKTHCFRVAVYINGEEEPFAVLPTSPGSTVHSWGGRTPEFRNATIAPAPGWGYKNYRIHNRGYKSNPRKGRKSSNLRYFTVYEHNGKDVGVGFHGDKAGKFPVTGRPESHGCLRVYDSVAEIINLLARAVVDNTGSANGVRLSAYHVRRYRF